MPSEPGEFGASSKEPDIEFQQKAKPRKAKPAPIPKHPETSPDNPFLRRPEAAPKEDHTREQEEKAEKRRAKGAKAKEAAGENRRRQEEFWRDEWKRQDAERQRQSGKNSKEWHEQRTENAEKRKREKAERNRRRGEEQKNKMNANSKSGTLEPGAQISDAQRQAWNEACELFFAGKEGKTPFPQPPSSKGCRKSKCVRGEILGVCHHEIQGLLLLDKPSLKKERLRFHPDKFPGGGQTQVKAQEMFQLIQRIIDGDPQRA